ncbi:MAG: ParB/RepB/Spo0J family partition protein [Janthinobacterium lividum]
MRALTKLAQIGNVSGKDVGALPEMPLEKILRDPENPRPPLHLRTAEEQQRQSELNASVRQRGVKSPISLRPHPTLPDMWLINHGHCRYDAAEAAGSATIPYFVDPNFDSYDQVAENLHRCDLSIWAIAAFIRRKLDEGHSKSQIAERLAKNLNYVIEHLALVDAPSCVHQAYANGVRSARTLYDLRRAHDEFPEQIETLCASGTRVTRDAISELVNGLRHDVTAAPEPTGVLRQQLSTSCTSDVEAAAPDTGRAMLDNVNSESLRHDVTPALQRDYEHRPSGLRHDVTPPSGKVLLTANAKLAQGSAISTGIRVVYRGMKASVAPETKVTIVLEDSSESVEVSLGDLLFHGAKQ